MTITAEGNTGQAREVLHDHAVLRRGLAQRPGSPGAEQQIHGRRSLAALKETGEVRESPGSSVFGHAENRLLMIKAMVIATIAPRP
jgi:hypothetical protein